MFTRITMSATAYLALLSKRPLKRIVYAKREHAGFKLIHVLRVEVH